MRRSLAICLILIAATALIYGRTIRFDFVSLDDPDYVTSNAQVRQGLTIGGVNWAFTTAHASNWHPLTWLSHMLDGELYGLQPFGHHLSNVLLHIVNCILLFRLLAVATGNFWPSAFVAALFAVHPLGVESVAWVSERKNLLSTLFALAAVMVYVRFVRSGAVWRYVAVACLFALGLMAKPMLVTLPLLLLLLDYWPLRRIDPWGDDRGALFRCCLEKLPLLVLSIGSSLITLHVQRLAGAMDSTDAVAFPLRLANAAVSCVRYIGKLFWPSELGVLYPHPNLAGGEPWSVLQVAASALLVLTLCWSALLLRRRRHLLVGWSWFLVSLLPMIGVVQVGQQAMADRYTYLPQIGLFIVVAWGAAELPGRLRPRWLVALAATLLLLPLALCAASQTGSWRDSVALYRQALSVSPRVPLLHSNLGVALAEQGRLDEAIEHYREAIRIESGYSEAYSNLGNALQLEGRVEEALATYRAAIVLDPRSLTLRNNLGVALRESGRLHEALTEFQAALQIAPGSATVLANLGETLLRQGRPDRAVAPLERAVAIAPELVEARLDLAQALAAVGEVDAALRSYRRVLELRPGDPAASLALQQLAASSEETP